MSMCSRNKKDVDEHRTSGNMTTTRKGPWTVEEDAQLVRFVRLFGERRWDFLAKVSGLRRTGKSCRLRWVNYLHPGLRRGCITADEERLVVELHARWGSRWSRIARSLPGRTDNEIKNFWRTRTRKHRALEERRQTNVGHDTAAVAAAGASASSSSAKTASSSSSGGSPNSGGTATTTSSAVTGWAMRDSRNGGGDDAEVEDASTTTAASQHQHQHQQQQQQLQLQQDDCLYTMDQLWNEIAAADAASYGFDVSWDAYHRAAAAEVPSSPVWELSSDYCSLWRIDDDEYYKKMLDASS